MDILLIVIAAMVVGTPLAAIALVSLAVFREQSLHSLIGRAPGPIGRSGRRLLAFHSEAPFEPFSQADVWRQTRRAGELALSDEPAAIAGAAPWWAVR